MLSTHTDDTYTIAKAPRYNHWLLLLLLTIASSTGPCHHAEHAHALLQRRNAEKIAAQRAKKEQELIDSGAHINSLNNENTTAWTPSIKHALSLEVTSESEEKEATETVASSEVSMKATLKLLKKKEAAFLKPFGPDSSSVAYKGEKLTILTENQDSFQGASELYLKISLVRPATYGKKSVIVKQWSLKEHREALLNEAAAYIVGSALEIGPRVIDFYFTYDSNYLVVIMQKKEIVSHDLSRISNENFARFILASLKKLKIHHEKIGLHGDIYYNNRCTDGSFIDATRYTNAGTSTWFYPRPVSERTKEDDLFALCIDSLLGRLYPDLIAMIPGGEAIIEDYCSTRKGNFQKMSALLFALAQIPPPGNLSKQN